MTNQSLTLITESGAPVADNRNTRTAGPAGPVLLAEQHLLARINRERIPERIIHAVGTGAYGRFMVTNPEATRRTRMDVGDAGVAPPIDHLRKADATYGSRVGEALAAARI